MSRRNKKGRNKGNNKHPRAKKKYRGPVEKIVDINKGPGVITEGEPDKLPPLQEQITIINKTLISLFQFLKIIHSRLNAIESFLSQGKGQDDLQQGMFVINDGRTDGGQ